MNEKELRELNTWIDETLFDGGKYVGLMRRGFWYRPNKKGYTNSPEESGRYLIGDAIKHTTDPDGDEPVKIERFPTPRYSTDRAAAMDVLKKCINKVTKDGKTLSIRESGDGYTIFCRDRYDQESAEAPTLELAICLFAKDLFSK
jgi:hypothetical protein